MTVELLTILASVFASVLASVAGSPLLSEIYKDWKEKKSYEKKLKKRVMEIPEKLWEYWDGVKHQSPKSTEKIMEDFFPEMNIEEVYEIMSQLELDGKVEKDGITSLIRKQKWVSIMYDKATIVV